MNYIEEYLPLIQENALFYGVNLVKAILILFIGRMLVKLLARGLGKAVERSGADPMLAKFINNIAYALMLAFVVIAAINQLGVQTASLIAILGAAGLAIGLALQGSLSNFAAGVMIIVFRPFNVADVVEVAGQIGKVEMLGIFTTTLRKADKTKVIIPNSQALDSVILNFTEAGERRLELAIGISYDADITLAKKTILQTLQHSELVIADQEIYIGVIGLGDSSVNLVARPWITTDNYYAASLELYELVKVALDREKIGIPYPQREVHMIQNEKD